MRQSTIKYTQIKSCGILWNIVVVKIIGSLNINVNKNQTKTDKQMELS